MLDLEYFSLSDIGTQRDNNEDFLGSCRTEGWLFVLADGVGGAERGEVAAQTAVGTVIEGFRAATGEAYAALLPRIVRDANARIYDLGGSKMATTVVAAAFRFDRLVIAHVGDSRCYLIRRGHASPLTRDHTVVSEQVRMGLLSDREATEAQTRYLLSRSLGADLFVNVDVGDHQVQGGDVVLLCSDGLHGPVKDTEMAEIVTEHSNPEAAARRLVALANERDGGDNVSVHVIRVRSTERIGMYRGRPYRLR